jgi:potassium efflux system protein
LAEDAREVVVEPIVSESVLKARLAEVEAASDLTDTGRERLIGLYRKSLSNLASAQANEAAATAYREMTETAAAEVALVSAEVTELLSEDPLSALDLAPEASLVDLERRLQNERADLASVQARHDGLVERLALEQTRAAAARQQLAAADAAVEAAYLGLEAEATESDAKSGRQLLTEARRWELETRYLARSTEIRMLEQELLSRPARLELLEAKRDAQAARIDSIAARIAALEAQIIEARAQAVDEAKADVERVRDETEGMDPVLVRLAEANAELIRELDSLTRAMRDLERARLLAEQHAERVEADYRDTRNTLESVDTSDGLGEVLLAQLNALPDLSEIREQRARRKARISEANVRRLGYRSEARRITDLDASISALAAGLQAAPTTAQKDWLRDLLTLRLSLLQRMHDTEARYFDQAQALDATEGELLTLVADYEALLRQRVVWLRTERPADLQGLLMVAEQLAAMRDSARNAELVNRALVPLSTSAVLWASLLASALLLLLRRWIIKSISNIATRVGKPTTDRFRYTLWALGFTTLLALPAALPVGVAGWVLLSEPLGNELTQGLGASLQRISLVLFALSLLIALCRPKGLAAVHFRWPEKNLVLLRTRARQLVWVLIPALVLLYLSVVLHPSQNGGALGQIAGTVAFGALAWFLFRVFHPRQGVLVRLHRPEQYRLLMRGYWLWYPLLALYPVWLIGLGLSGYLYTVTVEARNFVDSMFLLLGIALLNAMALRWLLVVRRRLAYEVALQRRQAALEAAGQDDGPEVGERQVEEPEVDLSALSDDSSGLIRVAVGAVTIVGLVLIWSELLPALKGLDAHTLWHTTAVVDGEEQRRAVTLLDLGIALLFAGGTLVLLKRLPGLLEILLLRRSTMLAADRYAVTTLTSYLVGAIGILLVLGTLGANWNQLQWMAAGLSVGIGFGLQEIVANFISGLIILFERPIRVGDTVTVGDTDGVVTKIRIRATTIRNFDRKELLVPNKEFITGRLLNWSLSDPVTRIIIVVGVAYGSDVDKALSIMKRLAEEHAHVTDDPAPFVTFDTFGDNALTLTLRAYVDSIDVRLTTITELNRAINAAFTEAGLNIAFPQRDVHVDTTAPLRVQIESGAAAS